MSNTLQARTTVLSVASNHINDGDERLLKTTTVPTLGIQNPDDGTAEVQYNENFARKCVCSSSANENGASMGRW